MAIKINKEIDELISLISNIFESFTTAFYEFDNQSNILKLSSFYSLSNSINHNFGINIGKSLKVWLSNLKKPISIKDDNDFEYKVFFDIYKKKEEIKTLFAVPVGNFDGLLYIDTKKSYTLPEKQQKLLYHSAQMIHKIVKIREAAKDIKNIIDYGNISKTIKSKLHSISVDYHNSTKIIDILSEFINFDFGALIFNEYDETFRIVATNFKDIEGLKNKVLKKDDTIVGTYLNNKVKHPKFIEDIDSTLNIFAENESILKDKIKNFLYFPLIHNNELIGIFIFFNMKTTYNYNQLFIYLYDLLYMISYQIIATDQMNLLVKTEPSSGFYREHFFYNYLTKDKFSHYGVVIFKLKNFSSLVNKFPLQNILKCFRIVKTALDSTIEENTIGALLSITQFALLYSHSYLNSVERKKGLIEKSFENRVIVVDGEEMRLQFQVTIFNSVKNHKLDIIKNFNWS